MTHQSPRQIAYSVLRRTARGEGFAEQFLEYALAHSRLAQRDRALCRELVYGVIRWQGLLDAMIARGVREKMPGLRARVLLRLGLYQLLFMDGMPAYAAVNETVGLASRLGIGAAEVGFVNAMLRGFADRVSELRTWMDSVRVSDPATGYSHPGWLYNRWVGFWGRDAAIQLMAFNNAPAPVYARVNTLRTDATALTRRWDQEGVRYRQVEKDWLPPGLYFELECDMGLTDLGSFKDGLFYVQDPAAALAVLLLDPKPGERVLDCCAAPGGKCTLMAQLMRDTGRIVAVDVSRRGLALLRENCTRLGITIVEPVQDLGCAGSGFDRVMLDVPCSNTGVMRRRVEVRWRISESELARLVSVQKQLLSRCAGLVKPGGVLVYSTCSIDPEENRGVVDWFLAGHPWFSLVQDRQLLPFVDGVDGAYAALFQRKQDA